MGMDVERKDFKKKRRRKRILYGTVTAVALILVTLGISSLEPAAMSVSRQSVWVGQVERGAMVRQVRGPGTLVPKEIRWVTSSVNGRVDERLLDPGVQVEPDTVILELTNPEIEQQLEEARLGVDVAETQLAETRVELESEFLRQQADAAAIESQFSEAELSVEANEELAKDGLIPEIDLKTSRIRSQQLQRRVDIEGERLAKARESVQSRVATRRSQVAQARALYELRRQQVESLTVRAGTSGVLQEVAVEVGERVQAGTVLA
ncbi:MAG: HlyD family secretion protein, partial [Thermoanaerobaculia bacterium]